MARKRAAKGKGDEAPREDLGEGIVPADDVIILMTADERFYLAEGAEELARTPGFRSGNPLVHRRVNTMRALVAKYDEAKPADPKEATENGGETGQ